MMRKILSLLAKKVKYTILYTVAFVYVYQSMLNPLARLRRSHSASVPARSAARGPPPWPRPGYRRVRVRVKGRGLGLVRVS